MFLTDGREETADLICRLTGRDRVCRTHETVLLPYRRFYDRERTS